MRLANDVSHMGELQQSADMGGRKKSELYQSIRRMGELAIAMDEGRAPLPPPPSVATPATDVLSPVNAKKRLLHDEPQLDELPDKVRRARMAARVQWADAARGAVCYAGNPLARAGRLCDGPCMGGFGARRSRAATAGAAAAASVVRRACNR